MTRRLNSYRGYLSGIGVKSGLEASLLMIVVVLVGLVASYALNLQLKSVLTPPQTDLSPLNVPQPTPQTAQFDQPEQSTTSNVRMAFESGRTAEAAGDFPRAYEAYRQAASSLQATAQGDIDQYIERKRAYARMALATGRPEEAKIALLHTLEEYDEAIGSDVEILAGVKAGITGELANISLKQQDYLSATNYAQDVIRMARPNTQPHSPGNEQAIAVTIAALDTLTKAQHASGNLTDAIAAAEQALSLTKSSFGPLSPSVGLRLERLADMFEEFEKPLEGLALRGQALAIAETDPSIDRDDLTINLNNLAEAYRQKGEFELARPIYEKAILIAERAHGERAPEAAIPLNNLGLLAQWSGNQQEAEEYYMKALSIIWEAMGPDHTVTQKILGNTVRLLESQGRIEDVSALKSQYGSRS